MTTSTKRVELIAERQALVEETMALNARQLLDSQARAGLEVELLSCVEHIERDGETTALRAQRTDLEQRLAERNQLYANCEQERDALVARLGQLDRHLAEL